MADINIRVPDCDGEGARGTRGRRGRRGPAGITNVLPFAASFRIQRVNNNPIVTVKDIVTLPGIFAGLVALSTKAECILYVFGNAITRGAVTASIGIDLLGTQNELLATMLQGFNVGGSWVVPVDPAGILGPTPAEVAAATPALPPVVAGQPILAVTVRTRYQSDAVTNETALLLDDVTMSFSGSVGP